MNKKEMYEMLLPMLKSLLENEHDRIANMANASALLYEYLEEVNWAGFYLYKNDELILGPFQGKVACMHIPMKKGVCGQAADQRKILRIANVHEFPTHIACDSASNSEIVIPLLQKNTLLGVLDIDSTAFDRFDETDQTYLSAFVDILLESF